MKHTRTFLAVLLCFATLAGCSRQPQLTVVNQSSVPLTKLIVSGSGFSKDLGTLAPGAQVHIGVSTSGESSLRLEFNASGQHFSATPDCYFENSSLYRVTATVAPDYSVKVNVSTKPY